MAMRTYPFKLVLLGDAAVGKSSIVLRFVKRQFSEYQESTIGSAFISQTVPVDDALVKFEIWDTAGQERYQGLAPMYYRGAAAAIIVFDITSSSSFQRAQSWVDQLQPEDGKGMLIVLVGNKLDMANKRQVQTETTAAYAKERGIQFFETSAKTNENITEMFMHIANTLPKGTDSKNQGKVQVDKDNGKKSKCC